jgi:hypothetical protein
MAKDKEIHKKRARAKRGSKKAKSIASGNIADRKTRWGKRAWGIVVAAQCNCFINWSSGPEAGRWDRHAPVS